MSGLAKELMGIINEARGVEPRRYKVPDLVREFLRWLPSDHKRAARVSGGSIRNDEVGWHVTIGVDRDDQAFVKAKDTRNKATIANIHPMESEYVFDSVRDVAANVVKWFRETWGGAKR